MACNKSIVSNKRLFKQDIAVFVGAFLIIRTTKKGRERIPFLWQISSENVVVLYLLLQWPCYHIFGTHGPHYLLYGVESDKTNKKASDFERGLKLAKYQAWTTDCRHCNVIHCGN